MKLNAADEFSPTAFDRSGTGVVHERLCLCDSYLVVRGQRVSVVAERYVRELIWCCFAPAARSAAALPG